MPTFDDTGFSRDTLTDIEEAIADDQRATISAKLDVSESSPLGNVNTIVADRNSQLQEVVEEVVSMLDPENATGSRLRALGLLTGVTPRGQTRGLVTATINLDAGQSYAAGDLVAHVLDEPDNIWANRDAVTSGAAGNYQAVFRSVAAGAGATAAAGTLTVIAADPGGWNSITNALDATAGQDEETDEELRLRRDDSLSLAGGGTVAAIRADVLQVDGVLQCVVQENTDDVEVDSVPARGLRVVVWDGSPSAADDDEIAQAIFDTKHPGSLLGGTESGNALSSDGLTVPQAFERATAKQVYISATIVSATGASSDDIKAAIAAAMPTQVGGDVVYNKLTGAAVNVEGVDNYSSFTLGFTPSPVGTSDLTVGSIEIAQLTLSNIILTGDVS